MTPSSTAQGGLLDLGSPPPWHGDSAAPTPAAPPPHHRVPSALAWGCRWLLPLSPTPPPCHSRPPPRSIYLKAAGRGGVHSTVPRRRAAPRCMSPPPRATARTPPCNPRGWARCDPPLHRDPNKPFQHPKCRGGAETVSFLRGGRWGASCRCPPRLGMEQGMSPVLVHPALVEPTGVSGVPGGVAGCRGWGGVRGAR